jgi:hypothetical protein
MNHTAVTNAINHFLPAIEYMRSNHSEIPFVLGEAGSALNTIGNSYDLEGVLGSALWSIDYLLYAATVVSPPRVDSLSHS